jgi:hypothetical protein
MSIVRSDPLTIARRPITNSGSLSASKGWMNASTKAKPAVLANPRARSAKPANPSQPVSSTWRA